MEKKKQNKIKKKEMQEEAIQWARFLYSAYKKHKTDLQKNVEKI